MKINQLLSLPPSTLTKTLPYIEDNLGFSALASPGVIKRFEAERITTTSFDELIFENHQWVVRGDCTIDEKINGAVTPRSYQVDGDVILDGCQRGGKLHETWPYHVCLKDWVDKQAFCDAYAVAYYHKNMSKARALDA